jgi:hypothetical protein
MKEKNPGSLCRRPAQPLFSGNYRGIHRRPEPVGVEPMEATAGLNPNPGSHCACPAQQRSRNQIPVAQGWRFSRPAAFPPIGKKPQVWEKHPALRYGAR